MKNYEAEFVYVGFLSEFQKRKAFFQSALHQNQATASKTINFHEFFIEPGDALFPPNMNFKSSNFFYLSPILQRKHL